MKKYLLLIVGIVAFTISCSKKKDNIYPELPPTELDYSLYPNGDSADYANNAWPTFSANTNTERNVLIEDFTGHRCIFCPPAADEAHTLKQNNAGRVYVASIHAGPEQFTQTDAENWNGVAPGDFQTLVPPTWVHNFANVDGLQIGSHFGPFGFNATTGFWGNPRGMISRVETSGDNTLAVSNWSSAVTNILTTNDLKVNIQAASNFYPSTRGLFLHTEIELLQSVPNDLYTVVYLMEDTLIAPQKFPSMDSLDYKHHDIMRGCLDSRTFGQILDDDHLENGKYYYNYSIQLPTEPFNTGDGHVYDYSNMYLLIYVRDNTTEEIYQVIEHHFI